MSFVREGGCSLLGQVSQRVKSAGAAVPIERPLATVLDVLSTGKWLALFVKCLKEQMFLDGVRQFDGGGQIVLVKSGLTTWLFCPSSDSSHESLRLVRACRTENSVL